MKTFEGKVAVIAGLLPFHFTAAYQATKYAVVAISEKLYSDPARAKSTTFGIKCVIFA